MKFLVIVSLIFSFCAKAQNGFVLENAEKSNYATDGIFRFGANTADINIKVERRINVLRDIFAFLLEKENFCKQANLELGIEEDFTWMGVNVETWKHDLQIRITQINRASETMKLSEMEKDLLAMDSSLLEEIKLERIREALS